MTEIKTIRDLKRKNEKLLRQLRPLVGHIPDAVKLVAQIITNIDSFEARDEERKIEQRSKIGNFVCQMICRKCLSEETENECFKCPSKWGENLSRILGGEGEGDG